MLEQKQKPKATFRAGQVSGALWENQIKVNGKAVNILKASVSRRYQDSNGEWKTSLNFSRNEIPLAIYCLGKAFEAIIEDPKEEINQAIEEQRVI